MMYTQYVYDIYVVCLSVRAFMYGLLWNLVSTTIPSCAEIYGLHGSGSPPHHAKENSMQGKQHAIKATANTNVCSSIVNFTLTTCACI